jgi:AbrB family looped-hinge helix DNA binding protein
MPSLAQFTNKRKRIREEIASSRYIKFSSRIDSKGRIVIPADIRKTLGLFEDMPVDLLLSVSEFELVFRIKRGEER